MKKAAILGAVVAVLLVVMVVPSSAQLGDVGNASFTVQNVGGGTGTVSITFVKENGDEIVPPTLDSATPAQPNPFDLAPGESYEVYVPGIPGLPAGRYSVIISSTQEVVAIVNLIGENAAGTISYNGSYSGASKGANPVYLPAFWYRKYGWNSLISIQNTGTGDANITVNFTCDGGQTGSLSKNGLKKGAAVHFDLETTNVPGLPLPGGCGGSAVVTSNQPVVVVDNQSAAGGLTQSMNTFSEGAAEVFIPALYHQFYGWDSSLNIVKIGTGNSSVSVSYSDGGSSSCSLTNLKPSCLLYMPPAHPKKGRFAATVTATGAPVVAIANAAHAANNQAQTYGGFSSGENVVGLPTVMKAYYGWDTSFTCQNVGTVNTSLNISYQGYPGRAYNTKVLVPGESIEVYQPGESFLPNKYRGSVTVKANNASGEVACIVNQTNPKPPTKGDWSMSYNAQ
jgi:hypothetical protein